MKISEWNQRVLLVTKDPEIQQKISSPFGNETDLLTVASTHDAIDRLTNFNINVLIIDTECTDPDLHYSEESVEISFLEITQYANQIKNGMTVIILVNAMKADEGKFAKKCGATLILNRKDISLNIMIYIIRVLRKRTFRTLLARDLVVGNSLPVNLYHYLPGNGRYALSLPAEVALSQEKKDKFIFLNNYHLYVREEELPSLLSALKDSGVDYFYSRELALVRQQYRNLIIQFFDSSTDGMIHFGKIMTEQITAIIERLKTIVEHFLHPRICMLELPYPRWSTLAHGINCAIYSLIFSKVCQLENAEHIAFAALIQNLGLAEIDQEVLKKKESDFSPEELVEYKKHINKTLELAQKKLMVLPPLVERIIKEHHENFDGTGFPEGIAGTYLSMEAALLSIIGSFDYFHTVRVGEKSKNIFESWDALKLYHVESTILKKKFHPTLLDKIEQFIKQ